MRSIIVSFATLAAGTAFCAALTPGQLPPFEVHLVLNVAPVFGIGALLAPRAQAWMALDADKPDKIRQSMRAVLSPAQITLFVGSVVCVLGLALSVLGREYVTHYPFKFKLTWETVWPAFAAFACLIICVSYAARAYTFPALQAQDEVKLEASRTRSSGINGDINLDPLSRDYAMTLKDLRETLQDGLASGDPALIQASAEGAWYRAEAALIGIEPRTEH